MTALRYPGIELEPDAVDLKVLVVDDQELNRRVMNILLKEFGCCATLAASGEEAVELAAATRFDVIFMDLNMPSMDGDEAVRLIRAAGASRLEFVVRWTTEAALWLDPGLYDAQAPKPINVPALALVVGEAIRRRSNKLSQPRFAPRNISPN
jgi:CheY-like chemotaxis protein